MGFPILPTMGVNRLDDPRKIRDDECVSAKNLVPYSKGMLGKRPARSMYSPIRFPEGIFSAAWLPFSSNYDILTVHMFNGPTIGYYIFACSLTNESYQIGSGFTVENVVGTRTPISFVYNGTLYLLWGPPTAGFTGLKYASVADLPDGAGFSGTPFSLTGTNNNFSPGVVGIYRDRVVYGNFGPGYENYIAFSDPGDPLLVGNDLRAANSRAVRVGARDTDRIVALVEITQAAVGSPSSSALLVLKEYSAYIINGEPNYTTDTGRILEDLIVSKISYDCGCSSASSVATTPYGVFWASWDDVWFFATGALPIRVGSKIRPVLAESPVDMRYHWQGAYQNGFYRLAVYSPGQGPSDMNATRLGEQWWLDLRDGPPQGHQDARWWGPQIYKGVSGLLGMAVPRYGTGIFLRNSSNAKDTQLYSMDNLQDSLATDGGGEVFVSAYDIDSTRDMERQFEWAIASFGLLYPEIWHDQSNTDIEYELITKAYDFDAQFNSKRLVGARVDYWTSITQYLKAKVIINDVDAGDEISALAEQTGLLLDADTVESSLARTFQESYLLSPATNLIGKTFQFKLYDAAGYTIGAYQDTLVVLSGATYYAVTLTQGHYTNLKTLLDHLVARITAVTGISCSHNVTGPSIYLSYQRPGTITLTFGSAVTLNFQTAGGSITAADLRESRALMSLLGWDTSANSASATSQVSTTTVYYSRTGAFQFSGMEVDLRILERETT